jgi:osmotically-inducible protein OsmY
MQTAKTLLTIAASLALVSLGCETDNGQSNDEAIDAKSVAEQTVDDPTETADLNDSEITTAVVTQLLVEGATPTDAVTVETNEGIVRLTGTVDAVLRKDRAEDIATRVKGVRGVVNNLEVSPPDVADDTLVKNIEIALADDPATDSFEVTVLADNGNVVLSGTVESFAESQLAARVAKNVRGVASVANNLEVSFAEERLDEEMEEEIRRRLAWDTRVDSQAIIVSVRDGDVLMTGEVPSLFQKGIARSLAWVRGVNDVNMEPLEIAWWQRDDMIDREVLESKTDEAIADAVRDALLYDPRVKSFDVNVLAEDGEVTLTGTVNNLQAKRAAESTTENVHGVWEVNNLIAVETEFEEFVDESITETIDQRLVDNPITELIEINVTTEDGAVTLTGTVDSALEATVARDVAATTPGVTMVINEIEIEMPNLSEGQTLSDQIIEDRIIDELFWSPVVAQDNVMVRVTDGVAELTGTVDTMNERQAAIDNAYEGGAIEVDADALLVEFGVDRLVPEPFATD